jgi:cupin fold WbuC family metalloprotein
MFILLQGSASVLFFDESGTITDRRELDTLDGRFVVEISPQTWHTLIITSPETVLMEIKPGPYSSLDDKDFASWAPDENSEEAVSFEKELCNGTIGSKIIIKAV